MPANQEHVHLAWPLWSDLRVIPTHGKFGSLPIPAMPVPPAGQVLPPDVLNTHTAWVKASKEIDGLMLMTMDLDIQKNLEQLGAYDMLKELKMLYAQQEEHELLQTVRKFHAYKQEEGHMGKTVTELHAMLKLHEQTLPPKDVAPTLHAIRAGRVQKTQKKKSHKAGKEEPQGKARKDGKLPCHWRRNCPVYLVELQKKKNLSQGASTSGIFTTELYSFPSTSWVYDTGCCTHSCITTHGLRGSKKLNPGALSLKPYSHLVERAKDLLGLIYTDVCGPFKTVPRQGARSTRTRRAIDRLCLHVDAEEHDKWLFKKKTAMDGAVHNYKARLVVKGFTQTNGIDYEETFSPIADIRAIGILIYIAAFYDYEIWQMDVKTAFFNGHLSQPAIFINVNIHLLN
ncbi:zinc finger, CCHC-type containing protein [Tanacetum coccineum]